MPPEQQATDIARTLRIDVPSVKLPMAIRLIAALTLIGGLSIIGSLFVDIGRPSASVRSGFYLLRLVTGVIAVAAAYGIIRKERWALWLYSLIALAGLSLNPITALIPGAALLYLYVKREHFTPSAADTLVANVVQRLKSPR